MQRVVPKVFKSFCGKNYSQATKPQCTALLDLHLKYGGKMVDFGGFSLPVKYADQSLIESHLHTRNVGSIFDVSHMLQTHVVGKHAIDLVESICPADIKGVPDGTAVLTVFTNEKGNILDDLIVTKVRDNFLYIVSNGATRKQDQAIMEDALLKYTSQSKDVAVKFLPTDEQSLIAVQGPKAVDALLNNVSAKKEIESLRFMKSLTTEIAGVGDCRVTRCGYTGEDGFEISVLSNKVEHLTEVLLNTKIGDKNLKLAGLGARDTLRLEAGLCLYGVDIDKNTTPIEAGLTWLIAKRRREEKNFPGSSVIIDQIKNGVERSRVGFIMNSNVKAPSARFGVEIHHNGSNVGVVTSGSPSPCLGKNIAMGYIKSSLKTTKSNVHFKIRDQFYEATITKMPFIQTKYFIQK